MTVASLLMGALGILGAGFIVAAMISGRSAYTPAADARHSTDKAAS